MFNIIGYVLTAVVCFVLGWFMCKRQVKVMIKKQMNKKFGHDGGFTYMKPYSGPKEKKKELDGHIITERIEAAQVVSNLIEFAERYGHVAVSDYYDLINVRSDYTDNNFGWDKETIKNTRIVPVRDGYTIKFPPAQQF